MVDVVPGQMLGGSQPIRLARWTFCRRCCVGLLDVAHYLLLQTIGTYDCTRSNTDQLRIESEVKKSRGRRDTRLRGDALGPNVVSDNASVF